MSVHNFVLAGRAISILRADLMAAASRRLIEALNAELSGASPEAGATHLGLVPEEVSGRQGAFLVVYVDGAPVGCGAVGLMDPETGELKRMYVAPVLRGMGLGRRLVDALEVEARALGGAAVGVGDGHPAGRRHRVVSALRV